MKPKKLWAILAVVLAVISALMLMQVNSVQATFSDLHATMVLLRFDTEILQKTPAGQYYESLFWKHNDELIEIAYVYPQHAIEFSDVTLKFFSGWVSHI